MGIYTRRHPGRTKLRHDAKTRPLTPARFEDEGRYFRCWNCGFICDSQRDSLGGSEDRSGIAIQETERKDPNWLGYGEAFSDTLLRNRNHSVLMEIGPDGITIQPTPYYTSTVASGCPLCGTRNWRGDYR